MNHRRQLILLFVVAAGLAWGTCPLRPQAQGTDPSRAVEAYYQALQAQDYARAASHVASQGEPLVAARMLGALVLDNPRLGRPGRRTVSDACSSNLRNIATALEMYSTDNAGRYPHQVAALSPSYLRSIPTCPQAGQDTYSRSYQWSDKPDAYTIFCSGQNHAKGGLAADHPRYTSTAGLDLGGKPAEEKPLPAWVISSFRVQPARVQGDTAVVPVEEIYSIHGERTRVDVELPMKRTPGGWRIDLSQARLPDLQAPDVSLTWLKSSGLGYSAAAFVSQISPASLLKDCRANLELIGTALAEYAEDHGGKYPPTFQPLAEDYLGRVPICKAGGVDTYSKGYSASPDGKSCVVRCQGHNHSPLAPDCPRFVSGKGAQDTP